MASSGGGRGSYPVTMAEGDSGSGVESHETRTPLLPQRASAYSWRAVILPFLFPALGGLLFGYDIGATSGAVLSLTSPVLSGTSWYAFSSMETGLVVSGSLYGALLGSLLGFNIVDSLGRRRELLISAIAYFVGGILMAGAPSLVLLVLGRLVYGMSMGLAMQAAPMYISETAPSQIRGTMVAFNEALVVGGLLLGYLVASVEIGVVGGWRVMYGSAIPIALVMGVGVWWQPPSPRWLLLRSVQGKTLLGEAEERARLSFRRLRGKTVDESKIEVELDETLKSVEGAAGGQGEMTFWEIFRGKRNQRAFLIGGGLVLLQQVTGQPSILYYAAQILRSVGFSTYADATRVAVILGVFKLVLTGVAIFYVDKLGRRPLLIIGVSGIVASLLALAAYYSIASGIPALAVGALVVYVGSYQLSFGPITWLIVSEVFPLRSRGRAMSLTILINFASNAVVAFCFAPVQDLFGAAATFLIFAVIGICAIVFVVTVVPETKGLTLEDIEAKLSR